MRAEGCAEHSMTSDRITCIISTATIGSHGFDFLLGDYRVHHRVRRPDPGQPWLEFDGTASQRALLGGGANVQEYVLNKPGGRSYGAAIRAYDPKVRRWAIWWIDGRYPLGALDPPVVGGFDHGVGTFYSDGLVNGKPTRTRFIWSNITPTSARWEQAYSFDAGKTWETNWIMTFAREPAVAGDFDFLAGSWMVHHHYLTGRLHNSSLCWAAKGMSIAIGLPETARQSRAWPSGCSIPRPDDGRSIGPTIRTPASCNRRWSARSRGILASSLAKRSSGAGRFRSVIAGSGEPRHSGSKPFRATAGRHGKRIGS